MASHLQQQIRISQSFRAEILQLLNRVRYEIRATSWGGHLSGTVQRVRRQANDVIQQDRPIRNGLLERVQFATKEDRAPVREIYGARLDRLLQPCRDQRRCHPPPRGVHRKQEHPRDARSEHIDPARPRGRHPAAAAAPGRGMILGRGRLRAGPAAEAGTAGFERSRPWLSLLLNMRRMTTKADGEEEDADFEDAAGLADEKDFTEHDEVHRGQPASGVRRDTGRVVPAERLPDMVRGAGRDGGPVAAFLPVRLDDLHHSSKRWPIELVPKPAEQTCFPIAGRLFGSNFKSLLLDRNEENYHP